MYYESINIMPHKDWYYLLHITAGILQGNLFYMFCRLNIHMYMLGKQQYNIEFEGQQTLLYSSIRIPL